MAKIKKGNEQENNLVVSDRQQTEGLREKESLKAKIKHLLRGRKRKAIAIIFFLIIALGLLFAVPATRYGILSNFIKKDITLTIIDSATMKPVSEADVKIGDVSARTDGDGKAKLANVAVGEHTAEITKKYYKPAEVRHVIPVIGAAGLSEVKLTATGRQVTVSVADKVKQAPLAKALLTVGDTSAQTDDKGIASIVLPANKQRLTGTIELDGYIKQQIEVVVSTRPNSNLFTLVPVGKLFYLSKQTGKINVMQSNLDGGEAKVIVEGTGKEQDGSTSLLAARDWKYLALHARREATKNDQLYLVDTKSGELKLIDQGEVDIQLVGWSGHRFIYTVYKYGQPWETKSSLKSYDAETGKLARIDESQVTGGSYDYIAEGIVNPYIIKDKIIYAKNWSFGFAYQSAATDRKISIMSINPDGSSKQRVKEFPAKHQSYIDTRLYKPNEVYFRLAVDGTNQYYEYEDGSVKTISSLDTDFYQASYPTYLLSPTGKKTFWTESRDGKNSIFTGDAEGESAKQLVSLSEYSAYGWYSDEYILLSKNGSELYIAAADKPFMDVQPLKITNYHKAQQSYPGYGYGYGGI